MAQEQAIQGFDLANSPSHLLHRAQQMAVNLSSGTLASHGLTLRQFAVLAALAGDEGQSQSRLVDQTGIDRSTLADMVSRMEGAGYIKRVVSKEDARAKIVTLMAKGRKAYESALPGVADADRQLLDMVRANRRAGFLASLSTIGVPEQVQAEPEPVAESAPVPESVHVNEKPSKPKKAKTKAEKPSKPKSAKADKPSKADKKKKKKKKK